jgi:hypothetical protein
MARRISSVDLDKLRASGADLDFVGWLKGESARIPKFEATYKLKDTEIAGAIRAATLMRSQLTPRTKEWEERYKGLEHFLWETLKSTFGFPLSRQAKDLKDLDHVLGVLLPDSISPQYREDIRKVAKLSRVASASMRSSRRRSGGKAVSEQTQRTRAAVAYLRDFTAFPFQALAQVWNMLPGRQCDQTQLQSRIRKGPLPGNAAADRSVLYLWRSAYDLDFRFLFPGPFPLAPEIEILVQKKLKASSIPPDSGER